MKKKDAQDNEFRSFFENIEDNIICFRDCLAFNWLIWLVIRRGFLVLGSSIDDDAGLIDF